MKRHIVARVEEVECLLVRTSCRDSASLDDMAVGLVVTGQIVRLGATNIANTAVVLSTRLQLVLFHLACGLLRWCEARLRPATTSA